MRIVTCLAILLFAVSCGGGSSNPTDETLTLTGTLIAGAQTPYTPASLPPPPPPADGDPLVGYQLYCVTFSDPPVAATGIAGAAGEVSLAIAAEGVPFGCFVLDTLGAVAGALVFRDGMQRGQTVTLTGDTDLGTITVDLEDGVAEAGVPGTGTLTGGGDVACPLGEWISTFDKSDSGCPNPVTSTFMVTQTPEGRFLVTFTIGPMKLGGVGDCTDWTRTDVEMTVADGITTLTLPADPTGSSCPSKTQTVTFTPNADCTQLTADIVFNNCSSCDGGCQCDGTLTCPGNPSSVTVTRR